jgi:hypothetical protein
MGMNGIIFEYMNEYGFHADLIYQWLFCHAPATPPHQMLSKYRPFSLCNNISRLSSYHRTYRYNFYPMTIQLPGWNISANMWK